MRRNVPFCLASLVLTVSINGCSGKKPGVESVKASGFAGAVDAMDTYTPPMEEPTYEADPYPMYGAPTPVETSEQIHGSRAVPLLEAVPHLAPRYHTVAKKDTLYGLARMYYGDQKRWKEIYEANRSIVSNPNKLSVGQRLLIP